MVRLAVPGCRRQGGGGGELLRPADRVPRRWRLRHPVTPQPAQPPQPDRHPHNCTSHIVRIYFFHHLRQQLYFTYVFCTARRLALHSRQASTVVSGCDLPREMLSGTVRRRGPHWCLWSGCRLCVSWVAPDPRWYVDNNAFVSMFLFLFRALSRVGIGFYVL